MIRFLSVLLFLSFLNDSISQTNTDRSGEAGAYELLINPHARTMGMMGINSAVVAGTQAMGSNISGLAMNKGISVSANQLLWMVGTETTMSNISIAGEVSPGNNIGFNINYMGFGKMLLTTTTNPEGIGTFSPYMLNLGLSFARRFSKFVNGGIQAKLINEGINNVSSTGFALDAGLQYTSGDLNDIHFGVFIRNIGFPMRMSGDGLTIKRPDPNLVGYDIPYNFRAAKFELPTQFSIALTKDFYLGKMPEDKTKFCRPAHRLSLSGSFVYNAFINNDLGVGAEYSYLDRYSFRFGYLYQDNAFSKDETRRAHMGIAAGFGVEVPMSKDKNPSTLEIAYNFRPTWVFNGTHNVGLTYMISKPNPCDMYEEIKRKSKDIEPEKLVKPEKPAEPKIIYKTDTVKVQLPAEIKTVIQYKDVNKIFKDFSQNIEFKVASSQLTPKGSGALDVIGDLMRNYPESRFNIAGHTDEMGKPENNMILSKNRANAVAKYLISNKSIPESSLRVEWFGQERPIADNKTEAGRAKNRRVEITVIDEGNLKSESSPPVRNIEPQNPVKFESPIDNKTVPSRNESTPTQPSTPKVNTTAPDQGSVQTPVSSSSTESNVVNAIQDASILDLSEDAKEIKFIVGTDSITRGAKRTLTKVAAMLSDATYSKIKIVSHTDNGSYAVSNLQLSIQRANKVKENLVLKSIPPEKIEIEGKGDTSPAVEHSSPDALEKNNRIELILIK